LFYFKLKYVILEQLLSVLTPFISYNNNCLKQEYESLISFVSRQNIVHLKGFCP